MEVPKTGTEAEKELYTISCLINSNKKKIYHYTPVLLVNANRRLGKAKYCTLRILLDSGPRSLVVLGKNTTKLRHKKTQPVKWST